VSFEEQIINVQGQISEHIFKVKWRSLCLLSFKYLSKTREVLKIGEFPSFSWGMFGQVTRLDQLRRVKIFDGL